LLPAFTRLDSHLGSFLPSLYNDLSNGGDLTRSIMDTVIKTTNLSRYFGEEDVRVKALDSINLEIQKGEFSAIIGPSGSGKTTLLHLIGGLDNPTSGEVELSGTNIARMSGTALSNFRRDHIGFIFQSYNLIPVLSAEENIEYIMLLQGVSQEERKSRVRAILETVGLAGLGDRRPAHLSGGQQQRVAVARAMVSEPDIILADEPTANLDSATGIGLLEMMRELNEQLQMTFVFSTHDQKIMDRANRLINLRDGRIDNDNQREA
jgi:putative ABC transport system ATP-binding protein